MPRHCAPEPVILDTKKLRAVPVPCGPGLDMEYLHARLQCEEWLWPAILRSTPWPA